MLAPRASSAFVCLRCELQRARPRLPVLARRTAHANFSVAVRRYDAFDEEPTQLETPRPRPRLSEHPLGRLRKRKGKAPLRATTARLEGGVKTLGDDSEIIVLKEVGEGPSEENATSEILPATLQEAINLAEALQQEKNPISPSEIVQQLDSLRPKTDLDTNEPHYVSQTAYVKLSRRLLRGFTGQQLSQYYSITKGVKRKEVGNEVIAGLKELQSQAKRPAERSEWHPGTTQINLRLPGLDVHRRSQRKAVSKHLLVDQILRDLWKLVLLEEIEAPGELELLLKPWQLTLLSSGSDKTPLDRVGKERRAKIEVHWPHSVLRITADKNTAEYAADDVEQLLQNTETKRFNLKPWIPHLDTNYTTAELSQVIPSKSLEAVAAMTGATVQVASGHSYLIRALDKNAVEEAERCLIRLLPLKETSTSTIDSTRLDAAQGQSYLSPVAIEKALLDFQTRNLTLGRWSLPVPRTPDSTNMSSEEAHAAIPHPAANDKDLSYVHAQVSAMLKKSARSPTPPTTRQAGQHEWNFSPEDQLVARFGQTLFPLDSSPTGPKSVSATSFVPSLPGLAKLLVDEDFKLGYAPGVPVFEYNFVAAPEQQNFPKDQDFPTLRVQFSHNERTGLHVLKKLHLDLDMRVHDVLLPDKALDIRFYRRTRLRLLTPQTNKMISDFKEAVTANIQSGEKLTAPNLKIDIPKWSIPGYAQAHLPGTRSVQYLFTGIRFRQSVMAKFMDNQVTVSTTQSGKLGSKSAALSAYYDPQEYVRKREHEPEGHREDSLKSFVGGCFKIADKITMAAGSNGRRVRGGKPRDEMSARKIRRQELQGVSRSGDATQEDAEQADFSMAEVTTDENAAEPQQQFSADMSQHLDAQDMEDPYLSSLLSDETSSDQLEDSSFVGRDAQSGSQEGEDGQSLKTAV